MQRTGNGLQNFIRLGRALAKGRGSEHEFCPRCDANLTLQKGYDNSLSYWVCKGCGEMLINPEVPTDLQVAWICDGCEALLNGQPGFTQECSEWTCTECGFVNQIRESELYLSEDEFQMAQRSPYLGLSDEDVLALSAYRELKPLGGREHIILVEHPETGKRYVKKLLSIGDKSIYEFLKESQIAYLPRIEQLYEGSNCLIVIEEYIEGKTLAEMLESGPLPQKTAIYITRSVCAILDEMHHLQRPIIHRDIKPSNIIVTPENKVFLLDMNAAKWYEPEKTDDTRHVGTVFYAAPEQAGYGLISSSAQTDIYAVGVMLNVMVTGCFPKEKKAEGEVWRMIERCIRLDAKERPTARDLMDWLDHLEGGEIG